MTHNTLIRTAPLESGTGRTVFGRVVPYGQVADIDDRDGYPYRERFEYGAFSRSIQERGKKIRLLIGHDARRLPIGKATEFREERDGLHATFEVAQTSDGDDALELIRQGVVDSFSICFRPIRDRRDDEGTVVRTEAALHEVSLVTFPAYTDALVGGVRSQSQLVIPRSVAERRLRLLEL